MNDEALNKGYEILRNRQLNVTSFEETKIQGNVSLDEDCAFFTSIPYDSGWTVKVDGKKVEKEDFIYFSKDDDNNPEYTYLCFNIPAGEHTVEFSFMPDGLILGIAVSVVTVIALIIAAIIFSIIRKKRANIPDFVPEIPVAEEEIKAIDLELDSFSDENTNEEKPEVQEPDTTAETAETSEESAEETFAEADSESSEAQAEESEEDKE